MPPVTTNRRATNLEPALLGLLREARVGLWSLLQQPRYSVPAALSVALGVGASLAVFAVFSALMLRPLPFPEEERLVRVGFPGANEFSGPEELMLSRPLVAVRNRAQVTPAVPSEPRAVPYLPAWLFALTLAAFALGGLAATREPLALAGCAGLALAACALAGWRIHRKMLDPLRTAANVLDALRHGDYTHRARADIVRGPVSDLLREINRLAGHLQEERGRAEEASALLQGLVERVDVAVLAFDEDAVLRWWNPAAERLFPPRLRAGTSARDLGAETFLSGPSERSVALPGSAEPLTWELRRGVFHRAGERYQFVLLSSAQRVRREEERAAWQRLVRVLGHEVNNTLAPIQSLAATCRAMLADDGPTAVPKVLSALEVVEHRAASLGHFISEFARLARLPEPRLEPLELGAHVHRVVALDSRCPVHVLGTQPVELLADGPLLEQALLNLIRNAIDASLVRQGAVTIDWHADADSATLSIIDEGTGVANLDNLFVPLFSTKPQGSGIGLVLARNIVEAHGGQLRLDNRRRASGCVARVTLPRAPRARP